MSTKLTPIPALALAAVLCGTLVAPARAAGGARPATSVTWGHPMQAPGIGALDKDHFADLTRVSCPAAGSCSAAGSYFDAKGHTQAFVINQSKGVWSKAEAAPGVAKLNAGGIAAINAISCAAAGTCAAGGTYREVSGNEQAFVIEEAKGSWSAAIPVPGVSGLNIGGGGLVASISCPTPGNCGVVGDYTDSHGNFQVFVDSEKSRTWGKAVIAPGLSKLNIGGAANVSAISCASPGSCAAVGYYTDVLSRTQAFLIEQQNGKWGQVREVPGTAQLNAGGHAYTLGVSCGSPGNCGAAGYYTDAATHLQAFVANEVKGDWSKAIPIPGGIALNAGGDESAGYIVCQGPSGGACVASGLYSD
ncbi:MAG TPA: hypothetical protein VG099_01925, partial [Gemmataceae bacterium]|nr:hypothetical protein [Gemmataceae bacterium]